MSRDCRATWKALMAVSAILVLSSLPSPTPAHAQRSSPTGYDLSGAVYLDEADSAARGNLGRARAYLDDGQWDEAIETLRQVMETSGGRVIRVSDYQYFPVRDYCHLQIAGLTGPRAEALKLYRSRVDPVARQWYEQGLAARDVALLGKVVAEAYCSSFGDDALFALGAIALEQADYGAARAYWEQLDPAWRGIDGRPLWLSETVLTSVAKTNGINEALGGSSASSRGLVYPDTDLNLADVRARLVLVSILEGSRPRAEIELAHFARLHPDAKGNLAGRSVRYADALAALVKDAATRTAQATGPDWPTFAGSAERNRASLRPFTLGALAWQLSLGQALRADAATAQQLGYPQLRVAEAYTALLSYHPVVVGDLLLLNNQRQVFALNLRTGQPAWPGLENDNENSAAIYTDKAGATEGGRRNYLGAPRFTLTAYNGRVYARMGSPITTRQLESQGGEGGALVCLDLATQGSLIKRLAPESEKWAFEGTPVCEGQNVYVMMRYSDVRPQSYVACFDADLSRMRWRRMICSAETPARSQIDEASHGLLTLHGDTLYANTNLGAVAALSKYDGQVKWVSLYQRAKGGDLTKRAAHFFRDLNPCVYYRGTLMVAPADCERIFALDAQSGLELWRTDLAEGAVHLLGVGDDKLIASGNTLWFIDVNTGKQKAYPEMQGGQGRGLLAGESVYFPTKRSIEVVSQDSGVVTKSINLIAENIGAEGGNLVLAGEYMVVVSAEKIAVLGPAAVRAKPEERKLTYSRND